LPARIAQAQQLLASARWIIVIGFALVVAAALSVAILVVRAADADRLVDHSFEVQQTGQQLLSDLQAAESGQRGYLLTEDRAYLQPFDRAMATVPGLLDKLHRLTADDREQMTRVNALEPLIDAKNIELRRTISLVEQGRRDDAIAIVNSDRGRGLMEAIRSELTGFFATERDVLRDRQAKSAELRRWLALLIILTLLSAAILAGVLAGATRLALSRLVERTRELEQESHRRQEAEATLRQAQKIEAVGQLSGGIAHDFNNLLTIIIGNLDTIKRRLADKKEDVSDLTAKLRKPLDAALQGADNAAQLTHRLLAFSRRQALEPARLDLNRLVSDMLDMLRRALGEELNIETVLAAGLWPAFADTHQVENTLLNLALNAKAAMTKGGCLTIETANTYLDETYARQFGDIDPGQYVLLSVTDTGSGIPRDILERVFEPFFTTKGPGEGSGLGLAMVHGFVKQSGGHIRIYSEEGHGTTVKIYLPRMTEAEEVSSTPAPKHVDVSAVPRARPHESILVVEDNEGVRDYARAVLQDLGYHVVEAVEAKDALALLATTPRINLLFTDVVLPGEMTGRMLANAVREKYPGLPVLFTTGYTRNAIVHQGRLDRDVHLLNKPYTQQDLARKVRELLDAAQMTAWAAPVA
jgi:signal transduction histidine kinase/ActR/RegA family two-component response regulator